MEPPSRSPYQASTRARGVAVSDKAGELASASVLMGYERRALRWARSPIAAAPVCPVLRSASQGEPVYPLAILLARAGRIRSSCSMCVENIA